MKKGRIYFLLWLVCALLCACSGIKANEERIRSLDFTVLDESAIPDKVATEIETRKAEPFEYIYSDNDYLYICIGYGEQKTKGYSIAVDDLYLTNAAIYAETTLLGPGNKYKESEEVSYPYIVIKTEYLEQTIVVK